MIPGDLSNKSEDIDWNIWELHSGMFSLSYGKVPVYRWIYLLKVVVIFHSKLLKLAAG